MGHPAPRCCGVPKSVTSTWAYPMEQVIFPPFPPHQQSWRGPRFAKIAKDGAPELSCLVESGTWANPLATEYRWRLGGPDLREGLFVFVGLGEQIAELIESSLP